jgi:hypothetical protein
MYALYKPQRMQKLQDNYLVVQASYVSDVL